MKITIHEVHEGTQSFYLFFVQLRVASWIVICLQQPYVISNTTTDIFGSTISNPSAESCAPAKGWGCT